MKLNIWLIFLFLSLPVCGVARDKGWVPIPKSVTSPLGKDFKSGKTPKKNASVKKDKAPVVKTVYEGQSLITEPEIASFILLLPQFRSWAKQNGEEAHPVLSANGKPDFMYSAKAAQWVKQHNFNSERFFCIMGKVAAGMVIVEEGNDFSGTRPKDMPEVLPSELELVRKHMDELFLASKNL